MNDRTRAAKRATLPLLVIDEEAGLVTVRSRSGDTERVLPMSDPETFALISRAWLRCGWDTKYVYSFTWAGRPIIQLPEDLVRIQERVWHLAPDVIIETGVAHGGSLVFFASLLHMRGRGRVIGVEVDLREANRAALDAHPLRPYLSLVDGSSIDPATVSAVRALVRPGERVLVVLDSCHTRDHVLAEMRAYGPLVTPGSYLVVCDGIMGDLVGAPRSEPDWGENNPLAAIGLFLAEEPGFVEEEPEFAFNEGNIRARVSYWPRAFLRRY